MIISDDLYVVLKIWTPYVDAYIEIWLSTLQRNVNVVTTFSQGWVPTGIINKNILTRPYRIYHDNEGNNKPDFYKVEFRIGKLWR